MSDTNLAIAIVGAYCLASIGCFLYLVWRRQWTWMGLGVAIACLLASAAHFQILVQMAVLPDYALAPASIGSITWHSGLAWGSLLLGISIAFLAAMGAALRPAQKWAGPVICLTSAYFLFSSGTLAVARWTASGTVPTISIGVEWPIWIGFPAFLILIIGPFLAAIPWSLMRHARLAQGELHAILAAQWLLLGTVVMLLVVIGAAFVIGVLQGAAGSDARLTRAAITLAGVVVLTITVVVLTMFGFRRSFLAPAVSIIESLEANRAVGDAVRPGSIWEPVARSLEQSSSELRESKAEAERARRDAENARAMLQAFSDNVPAGLSIKDRERNFTMINEFSARNYYLAKAEDLIGKNADSFRTSRHGDHLQAMEQLVFDTGKPQAREVAYKAANDQLRHMHLMFFPILGEDGTVTHIGSLTHDITDQRQVEEELADQQARFKAFFNKAPVPMYVQDLEGQVVLLNDWVPRMYGASMDPKDGLKAEIFRPGTDGRGQRQIERVLETREPQVEEYEYALPTGTRIGQCTLFAIEDAQGEVKQIGGIIIDITEERRAQAELDVSRDAMHQSEKLAALGQLLAGVSHELNNPLAAVIGQTALLAEDLDGSDHADRVRKIRRAADRCARIVQSFLAMARQKAPEYRMTSLNDLVRQAVELTEYQMRAGNVLIDLQLDNALPAIEADPDQLHQVIVNLLTNARQAMEDNAGERRVTIATSQHKGQVKLRVADNGKGIPQEARARIFEPFFSTKDVGSGTGIGLSYSLGIVEAHAGKLELEDTSIGSAFAISLPVAKGTASSDRQDDGAKERLQGRVLVIDDEEDIADTLRDMLTRLGLKVTVALGGKAGLEALEQGAGFDLILSDIRMPEVDGPAVHAWINANRPELVGRIAFVTGDTMGAHAAQFLASVDRPVLEKPFSSTALRDLAERMLQS